ncbi:MAG: NYN domain-containing protein [Patescibacteria group bacterium]
MIKHKSQRVGVFIDVQNMYYSAKNLYNCKVNFGGILETAVADRQLIRAIAYVVKATGEEKPFFDALFQRGLETKERELQVFIGGAKKADWDVGIAVDAIRIGEILDVVVLVSGDGDFVELVEYLKHHGRQVECIAFRETASSKLVAAVDDFVDLSQDKDRYLIKPRGGVRRAPRGDRKDESAAAPSAE